MLRKFTPPSRLGTKPLIFLKYHLHPPRRPRLPPNTRRHHRLTAPTHAERLRRHAVIPPLGFLVVAQFRRCADKLDRAFAAGVDSRLPLVYGLAHVDRVLSHVSATTTMRCETK